MTVPLPQEMLAYYRMAPSVIPNWNQEITLHGFAHAVFLDIEKHWRGHPDRKLQWDWVNWHAQYAKESERFEAAIRHNSALAGLVLGVFKTPTADEPARLDIGFLEGRPGEHPLKGKIAPIILDIAYFYAISRGATEVRIVEPLPKLVELYEALGYKQCVLPGRPIYCSRPL